jgi:hypothetical protein
VDNVVTAPLPQEVAKNGEAESERREKSPPAFAIDTSADREADDLDAGKVGWFVAGPLPRRDVRNLMAGLGKAHGKAAHPVLGTSDRVRVQTVVDEAHSHCSAR